jgi:hypothetical protein
MDLEGSGRGLIEALFRYLTGGTEEDHETLQSERTVVPRPRFVRSSSLVQGYSIRYFDINRDVIFVDEMLELSHVFRFTETIFLHLLWRWFSVGS